MSLGVTVSTSQLRKAGESMPFSPTHTRLCWSRQPGQHHVCLKIAPRLSLWVEIWIPTLPFTSPLPHRDEVLGNTEFNIPPRMRNLPLSCCWQVVPAACLITFRVGTHYLQGSLLHWWIAFMEIVCLSAESKSTSYNLHLLKAESATYSFPSLFPNWRQPFQYRRQLLRLFPSSPNETLLSPSSAFLKVSSFDLSPPPEYDSVGRYAS